MLSENPKNPISAPGFERIEFFRNGLTLAPEPDDRQPGFASLVLKTREISGFRGCTCPSYKKKTCRHILELTSIYKSFLDRSGGRQPYDLFETSPWAELARVLSQNDREKPGTVSAENVSQKETGFIRVLSSQNKEMLRYYSPGQDAILLLDRLGKLPGDGPGKLHGRFEALEHLARMTYTPYERALAEKGFDTNSTSFQKGFWHRLAYHGYHAHGDSGLVFNPSVDETTGEFNLIVQQLGGMDLLRLNVPRGLVKQILMALGDRLPTQNGMGIHPVPLKSIFKISATTELDLDIRPMVRMLQEDGEDYYLDREGLERFIYGNLVYVKELGVMAELERPEGPERRFKSPVRMTLKKAQVPGFLEENAREIKERKYLVDQAVRRIAIEKQFDRVEVGVEALERDWCWLDVRYGFGNQSISLAEVIQAKKEGRRYVSIPGGWVDCQAEAFGGLDFYLDRELDGAERVRLSRMDLLRLKGISGSPMKLTGDKERARLLKRLMELKPARPKPELHGLSSGLRGYQETGLNWLRFLAENSLGGLLCDDMGLGKTHQAMALMVSLLEDESDPGPMMVVCPTTVLSHWLNKITEHAPGLAAWVYHGAQRDLAEALNGRGVVLTSYGILRNDAEALSRVPWGLVVFDEIQHLKNPDTKSHQAARGLPAAQKIGLTGTPIENRLEELKAIFDLVLPGCLGADREFQDRYVKTANGDGAHRMRDQLRRLVSPFVLRRLKSSVLKELPPKIEDIRTCPLSEDQVKLYRDAVSGRGSQLAELVRRRDRSIPYMHIFALLNLLKQICCHPALVNGDWENHRQYESGKWDLFEELLEESLDSGQKIVVYSQYLDMIKIIESHLSDLGVGCTSLTGQSRNREAIIAEFNENPDCRVFVGSLKAGGVGIDLVAASVVIHYDRWWNAARENQATDRVHRIGQRRGVQIFKLVTAGTLEEKISAMIDKKRGLIESVVPEDDSGFLKGLDKEQIMELISWAGRPLPDPVSR